MNQTVRPPQEQPREKGWIRRFSRRHSFRPGRVRLLLLVAVLLVIGLGVLGLRTVGFIGSNVTELGLRNIGELATQAGYFTSVQTIKQSRDILGITVPLTQSNYIFSYDGVIKAGFDFEQVKLNVNELTHVITVTLPEPQVLSVEVDENSFKLYNDGENIFTPLKMSSVNAAMGELKKTARETAIRNGLLDNAVTNAELLLKGFLAGSYDMSVYQVVFEVAGRESP